MSWRFHLMNLPDRSWVTRDLQLLGAQVTRACSGPASIDGHLPLGVLDPDDIREWGSLIIAEEPGREPVAAIVDRVNTEGDRLLVSAGGWSMYPNEVPWLAKDYVGFVVDPLDMVRKIWSHVLSYGDFSVAVDSAKSPVTIGIPEDPKLTAAKAAEKAAEADVERLKKDWDDEVQRKKDLEKTLLSAAGISKGKILLYVSKPSGANRKASNLWIDKDDNQAHKWSGGDWVATGSPSKAQVKSWRDSDARIADAKKVHDKARDVLSKARKRRTDIKGGEAEPFRLAWWETEDLGETWNNLAADTPFEYVERNSWINDGADISHRLQLGYPTVGVRRPDLRFEIGVNVTVAPPLDESDYASEVVMFGAGEGSKKVRATVAAKTNRLRRVKVATDKALTSSGRASSAARAVLAKLAGDRVLDTIQVVDHPAARYGTFHPGDQIRIKGDAGWAQLDVWVRILEITINCTTGAMSLRVEAV